jgi:uncharacterized membrane protein YedE/YeeE
MRASLALFVPGLLFGVGLAISGMTDPAKVIGFLDIAGGWDPSLAFVMGGAVVSFGLLHLLIQHRGKPILAGDLPGKPDRRVDPRLCVGASLFGIGWGLGGFCPGPALANLGYLRAEVLVFVPAMVVGMLVAQHGFRADKPASAGATG